MKRIYQATALALLLTTGAAYAQQTVQMNGFTPRTRGTPISVTTGGVAGTLPAGAVVVATNVGTTNAAYCRLGSSATTSDQYIAPAGGWFAFTVGSATQLTCITSTSTTTVNMAGGNGLPTGTGGGGGSGGGGGGAVTIADCADVTQGCEADTAWSSGSGTVIALLKNLAAGIAGSVPTNPKTTTQAKLTIAVTNTYQQALASNASRVGCTIQYIAVAGTKGFVFFGSAPADTTTSFQLTNGQTVNCNIGGVAVAQDAIQVTGTGTDIFIVANQ